MTEEEYIARGMPIEGAFRSLIEKAFSGLTLAPAQENQLRSFFFAGARGATFFLSQAKTLNEQCERTIWVEAELERFAEEYVAGIPTDGSA